MREKKTEFKFAIKLAIVSLLGFLIIMLFGHYLRPHNTSTTSKTSAKIIGQEDSVHNLESPHQISSYKNSPEQSVDLTSLLQYAFVTDRKSSKLAVVDLYINEVVAHIQLQSRPDFIEISRGGRFILYAQHDDKKLYHFDLKSQQTSEIKLPYAIDRLSVHKNGRWAVYTNSSVATIVDLVKKTTFDISISGEVSFLFLGKSDTLFVAELSKGKLRRVDLESQQLITLFELNQPMSEISVMPNLIALFFASENNLYKYSLLDEVLIKQDIKVANERPYITSESRTIITLSDKETPELLVINAYTLKTSQQYPLKKLSHIKDRFITGWLEQIVVVASKNGIENINLSKQEAHHTGLANGIINMLVQADTKTLLATIENDPNLLIYNVRDHATIKRLHTGLSQPGKVLMGQTNTVCH